MPVITKLLEGYKEFYKKYFQDDLKLFKQLKQGQSPKTLIIACSDSRVDPSIVVNAKPGDIFVIRNVANLVPPYQPDDALHGVSASLEFAVKFLNIENIIILGHSKCAGIHSLMNPEKIKSSDFIGKWMSIADEARVKTKEIKSDNLDHQCEKEVIKLSLKNLLTFPWIYQKVKHNELALHGWHFCIETGEIIKFNSNKNDFEKII